MFLQAGFNPRVRGTRIVAFVWHARARWRYKRAAELVQWQCGDLAWWGSGGISWGTSLVFENLVDSDVLWWQLERSPLP